DVGAELVEDLLARVVVEVGPLVGAAHDCDHEVVIGPDLSVAHRRAEEVAMLLYPCRQVDRHHRHGSSTGRRAIALISTSRWGWGSCRTATVVRAGPSSAEKCSA